MPTGMASGADSSCRHGTGAAGQRSFAEPPDGGGLQLAACCKVCSAGKACGNSCISRAKQCHKPPACACDAR